MRRWGFRPSHLGRTRASLLQDIEYIRICFEVLRLNVSTRLGNRHHLHPMRHGFMYLSAVIDWYSRYVLSWELSNSLDSLFCIAALERALFSLSKIRVDDSHF